MAKLENYHATDFSVNAENAKKAEPIAAVEKPDGPLVLKHISDEKGLKVETYDNGNRKTEIGPNSPFLGDQLYLLRQRIDTAGTNFNEKIGDVVNKTIERGGAFSERVKGSWAAAKEAWNKSNEKEPSKESAGETAQVSIAENISSSNEETIQAQTSVESIVHSPTPETISSGRSTINKALEKTTRAGVENQGLVSRLMRSILNAFKNKFRKAAFESNKNKISSSNPEEAAKAQQIDAVVSPQIDALALLQERYADSHERVSGLEDEKAAKPQAIEIPVASNANEIEKEANKTVSIENGYDDNIYAFNAALDEEPDAIKEELREAA